MYAKGCISFVHPIEIAGTDKFSTKKAVSQQAHPQEVCPQAVLLTYRLNSVSK